MKILYISNAPIPSEQSRSLSIMRVCQAFADAGHDVTLTALTSKKNPSDPVKYYGLRGGFRIATTYLNSLLNNRYMRKLMITGLINALKWKGIYKETNPDLIYSRLTILELLFAPRETPIIYEMHSLSPLTDSLWQREVFKYLVRHKNFRRIIVTTNALKENLQKYLPRTEIVIARLSAEPPVEISSDDLQKFKTENLQGDFAQNVGYTGFLDTEGLRGTDIIIQTAARMPGIGFHIVGGEPEIVEYWKTYAKDYNAAQNIFFYGYRNPAEIPYFLNCFDVVLAPVQFKPSKRAPTGQNMSPLKIPQYMGYAKAIVASDLNAHSEILEDGKTAFLVPHNDVKAWKEAIEKFLTSKDLREKFGQEAQKIYKENFTPQKRLERILKGIPA